MKSLIVAAALIIAMTFVITSCNDRTRETCETKPTATRCNQ